MRLLLGATAAMLSPIYELGSALLSVASQDRGQEDAQRTGVRCGASACSVQKLASQTASCKVLPGHCSTPVQKQLLSRLSPHIAETRLMCPPPPNLRVRRFYCKGDWPSDHTLFHAFCRASQEDGSEKVYAGPRSQSQLARTGIRTGNTWELPKPGRMGYGFASPTRGPSPLPRTRESLAHLTPLEPALLT